MRKVFVFGNSLVEKDSLAFKVAERLKGEVKGIEFVPVASLDDVDERDNLLFLDTAFGIEKVQVIQDLGKLETRQPLSGHDFDLAIELKLLQKLGKLGKVKIIAVPAGLELGEAVKQVKAVLTSLFPN